MSAEGPPATPDDIHVQEAAPTPAVILHRLRSSFPNWAFLHDPSTGMWTALRGTAEHGTTICKPDPLSLRLAVEETLRGQR